MNRNHKIRSAVMTAALWTVCFLGILIAANYAAPSISNIIFRSTLAYLDSHALVVVAIMALFMIGEVVRLFGFPKSVPAPFFEAMGIVFIVSFFVDMTIIFDQISGESVSYAFMWVKQTYPLIYMIVLIIGLFSIFSQRISTIEERKPEEKAENQEKAEKP